MLVVNDGVCDPYLCLAKQQNTHTLQKQVGCFNHRVVTLVADKLERQWLPEVFFGMSNCIKQPKMQQLTAI